MYTVPVRSALNVLDAVRLPARPWELTDDVGIAYDQLRQPDARIPLRQLVALYETAARRTRESTLGLRVGAGADPRMYGLIGYIIMNSATLGEALANAARYLPLWTDGAAIEVIGDGAVTQVVWEYLDPGIVESRQDSEMTVLTLAEIGRRFAGGVAPKEVYFRHSAASMAHRRLFGAPVRFDMRANALLFDTTALRTPMPGADRQLRDLLARYADERLVSPRDLVDRVRAAMPGRLETIAQRLGMSVRSLERRLGARGTSFRALQSHVRQELATRYLRETDMGVARIAERLGYASAAELHRAFRAWTGMTPGAYRKQRHSR